MSSTDHLSELESLRSQVADLTRALAERDHSMQDLREQSQLLRTIIEGTAAETGDEFFSSFVKHLTSTLHVQYAVIGEVLEGRLKKIRTLAVSAGGILADNFEYELAHTPCATALTQTFAWFDQDVQATFPQCQRLADLGAESYCAVPLRTKSGTVIGLLVVMDTKPLEHSDHLQSLLGVFAPHIAAEFERRRAEQERAQALADLNNAMETVPDVMFTLDTQGNMVKWNRRVVEVTGYSPDELLNKPALSFVPPEEQIRTAAAIQKVFMEGYAELEGQMLTKDLSTIPYHWTGAALKDSDGRIIGIIGVGRDVSEKKRAEVELQRQRRHLVEAQALAHLGSWEWELDSGEVQWSDEQYRIFGHEPGAIAVTDDTFLTSLHPDDNDRALAAINDALLGNRPTDVECRIVRPDGTVRFIHVRGDVHRDATGHPLSMAGTVLDITERKQTEEALRISEERWQLAARGSNDGIWDWNVRTGAVYFSVRWKAMRGYEESELANSISEWQSRIHPDDLERVLHCIDQYLAKQRPEYCEEYRVERKDGSYMWVLDRGMALWADDGTPLRMAGSETDITERKRAYSLLMAVINSTADGLLAVDREGKVTIANKRFLELWRIPKALLDRGDDAALLDLVLEQLQEPEAFLRRVRELYAHPEQESLDMLTFKDGRVLERYSRAQVLKEEEEEEEEEIVGRVWSFRDFTVRLRTEEALRASEERFALALEGSSDIFWDASRLPGEPWYAPQTPVWWSPRIRKLLGLQESESFETFEQWAVRLHPDDKDRVFGQLAAHIEHRVPYDAEYRLRTNRGDYLWIRERGQAIWDEQGEPCRMSGSCQDITERKQGQDALVQSERQLRTVLDALPVGVWFTDRSGKPLFGNPAAKEIWSNIKQIGLQTPDNQSSWWETIKPANEPHRWALSRTLTTGVPSLNETLDFECLDGTKKVIRNSTVPVQDEAGNILGAIVLNEDITMLRQAQTALQLTQFSVDHAIEGFFWIGPDARIFHVNDSACRMLEYTREELTTMTVHDIDPNFPPEVWPAHWEELKEKGSLTFESKHWSRTGRVLDTEVTVNYLQYEGREYNCAIMRDIAERKRAEQEQHRLIEELTRSQQHFQTLFNWTPSAVGISTVAEGQFCDVNEGFSRLTGYAREEVIGRTTLELGLWADPLERATVLREIRERGYLHNREGLLRTKSGEIRSLMVSIDSIQLGSTPCLIYLGHDITERKRAEHESHERAQQALVMQSTLLELAHLDGAKPAFSDVIPHVTKLVVEALVVARVSVWLMSEDRTELVCEDLYERSEDAHSAGTRLTARNHPRYFAALEDSLVVAASDARIDPRTSELAEGYLLPLGITSMMVVPIHRQGKLIGVLCHEHVGSPREWNPEVQSFGASVGESVARMLEAAKRKRAEEELRNSHDFLRQVIDIDPNFIFAKDQDGRFTLVNKAVADAYGTTVDELIGKTDADFNPNQKEVEFFRRKDLEVMDSLQDLFIPEEVITDSKGRTRWLQTVKRPIFDKQGRATMVLGAASDITDRKRMEETLHQRERDLRAAIEERERISQDLHDGILQSLFAVGLALETTKLMMSPWKRKTSGPPIDQAIDQLNRVMHEIRNFIARLGSDLLQGKDLLTALQHMLASLTENQATRVHLAVEDRAAKAVSVEQSLHLFLVIQEAVSNCIQHGRAQEARVSLKMLKQGVRLSIRDNGRGFNPDTAKWPGHGLGNMAARAQKIGGRFTILSKVNEGTRVVLDLPKEASSVSR